MKNGIKKNEENQQKPYWKRMHHSFIFWVFLGLMFAGIIYYIMTVNFVFAPQVQEMDHMEDRR